MAFPPRYPEPSHELPSIGTAVLEPYQFSRHQDESFPRSPAVSIPGVESRVDAPPPLPPPRLLPMEGAPSLPFDPRGPHIVSSSHSGSHGYGSMDSGSHDYRNFDRRNMSTSNGDEGYASYSTDRSRDSFPSHFGLALAKVHMQSAADRHSDNMKKKLDPIRTIDSSRLPPTSHMPMQLPIHSHAVLESPSRHMDASSHSSMFPRSAPFPCLGSEQRSPNDTYDVARSPLGRSTRNNSDDVTSIAGNFDYQGVEDMDIDDASSLKRLHNEEERARSHKRRAGSSSQADPPIHGVHRQTEPMRQVNTGSNGSYTPRLSLTLQSFSQPSQSISGRRSSGGGYSTGHGSRQSSTSPFASTASLNTSPRESVSGRPMRHARTMSGNGPRSVNELHSPTGTKLHGFIMCECCPKKPRKFATEEQLKAHSAEKQYGCNFCGNRFKNKNEAERHQNSLHVRRHSWSCSALSGYDRAFHDSPHRPGEFDACGYCGEEFARSGLGAGSGALTGGAAPILATDADWDERIRHLQDVHKFRECNSSKKFFRADHFRQHLKHSHAGTSGKWTNVLENSCMMDEDSTPR